MGEQVIIAISREYGSAGHEIAKQIAEDLKLPFYDQILIDELARADFLGNSEENEMLTQTQFDIIKKHAESGESFVIVGRCAEYILKGYKGLISVFVLGDIKQRQKRIMNMYQMNADEAKAAIMYHDRQRQNFHNGYTDIKWGEAKGYDMCVNSSKLGVENTVKVLEEYIQMRIENM